jgi:outer membrane protein assembly factor BamE (lipoprotein component of BamABCDE complex)
MKAKFFALPLLSLATFGAAASAQDTAASPAAVFVAKVEPDAFKERPLEWKKKGVTVSPMAARMITPGMDKFSIYNLIGPPHFGETITRRWNYVLFFPVAPGSTERVRCRMEIRFGSERPAGYHITVSDVVWKDQACADRVAAAS